MRRSSKTENKTSKRLNFQFVLNLLRIWWSGNQCHSNGSTSVHCTIAYAWKSIILHTTFTTIDTKQRKKTAQIKRINDLNNEPNENLNGYDMHTRTSSFMAFNLSNITNYAYELRLYLSFSFDFSNEYILTIYFEL